MHTTVPLEQNVAQSCLLRLGLNVARKRKKSMEKYVVTAGLVWEGGQFILERQGGGMKGEWDVGFG